ncbi:MAG: hypothetical protein HY553_21785 [Elusimicrobia bacterium]|nr:hypothetical protein [Elusimicrobiota bacterium]
MKPSDSDRLVDATRRVGKTYGFNEAHDPARPADWWFQETPEGNAFFLVLYTQACLWSVCTGCNLPSLGSRVAVSAGDIRRQLDFVFASVLSPEQAAGLGRVTLSNNGSVLDERTFPTEALAGCVRELAARCPKLQVLTLESRAEYLDAFEFDLLASILREGRPGAAIELAVGFEAFDDRVRNAVFRKGLTLRAFEAAAALAARHAFRLKAYFMLKPVEGMSEDEAVADVARGVDYLDALATKYGVAISMHLNATYVAKGTPLAEAFRAGRYEPPRLESLQRAGLAARGKRISLFLGLYDENLAVPGGSFIRAGDEALLARLQAFNRTQDFGLLAEGAPA